MVGQQKETPRVEFEGGGQGAVAPNIVFRRENTQFLQEFRDFAPNNSAELRLCPPRLKKPLTHSTH